jgi:hypothetical protein
MPRQMYVMEINWLKWDFFSENKWNRVSPSVGDFLHRSLKTENQLFGTEVGRLREPINFRLTAFQLKNKNLFFIFAKQFCAITQQSRPLFWWE